MPIRGVVLDVSETLLDSRGMPVPGLDDFWLFLRERQIRIIVASNQRSEVNRLLQLGYKPDAVALPDNIGNRKPSGAFVTVPAERLELRLSELIYVGDNDKTDAICASWAGIPYLRANWADPKGKSYIGPNGKYGIGLGSLSGVSRYIQIFLLKETPWFGSSDGKDSSGRPFRYRAMVDCRNFNPQQSVLKDAAVSVLKDGALQDNPFFLHHLLASLHLSGIASQLDYWTTYPSSTGGSQGHPVLSSFLGDVSPQFRDKHSSLLVRHEEAPSSRRVRKSGGSPKFDTQVRTVCLNRDHHDKLINKQVLLVDDFTTDTYAFEWARNLLLSAGAKEVTCVAVGKFGGGFNIISPTGDATFDPFQPVRLSDGDFDYAWVPVGRQEPANVELQASYNLFRGQSPWDIK